MLREGLELGRRMVALRKLVRMVESTLSTLAIQRIVRVVHSAWRHLLAEVLILLEIRLRWRYISVVLGPMRQRLFVVRRESANLISRPDRLFERPMHVIHVIVLVNTQVRELLFQIKSCRVSNLLLLVLLRLERNT